jgi:predicted lipid carrier protein YhbT
MITDTLSLNASPLSLKDAPRLILAPVPLPLLQPFLGGIVRQVAQKKPELFRRLGPHQDKKYLIDPVNLPFVFLLEPRPGAAAPAGLPAQKRARARCPAYPGPS